MFGNIVGLLVMIVLVVLFAWLTRRAWRAKRPALKWAGAVLAGLATLILLLATAIVGKGLYQLNRKYPVAAANVTVAGTPEQIARGEHLASVLCASCHTTNGELPLSGGFNLSEDSGLPLGDIYPPNITPAGKIKDLSDNDLWRILRTGVEPGGRLTFMTGVPVRHIADEDAKAIIAYLRNSRPVEKETRPVRYSLLLAAFVGAGLISFDVPATIQPVSAPLKAVNKEYGEYVKSFMDCTGCHGSTLAGDAPPPAPPAPNITVVVPHWSKDDFFTAMRTGVRPDGRKLKSPMPWKTIGKLDDVELEALYEYLHSLTPVVR